MEKVDNIQSSMDKLLNGTVINPDTEPYIPVEEACKIIQRTKVTIYKLCRLHQIPHYKNRKMLMFKESELKAWMAEGKQVVQVPRDYDAIMDEMRTAIQHKPLKHIN
jgi:excisionase family DNA binding protein